MINNVDFEYTNILAHIFVEKKNISFHKKYFKNLLHIFYNIGYGLSCNFGFKNKNIILFCKKDNLMMT